MTELMEHDNNDDGDDDMHVDLSLQRYRLLTDVYSGLTGAIVGVAKSGYFNYFTAITVVIAVSVLR